MSEIITAEKARELSLQNYDKRIEDELKTVGNTIMIAVERGEYRCRLGGTFHIETVEALEEKGYTVGTDAPDGIASCIEISWEAESHD